MQASTLFILLVCTSCLLGCTTAQDSSVRRLWSIHSGKDFCSFNCNIFAEKCPYPTKCTDKYWLQRQKVNCFKRDMQLHVSGGKAWCGEVTNPNWSNGIGRPPRRLSSFIRRLTRAEKAIAASIDLGASRLLLEEVIARRRLASCAAPTNRCPSDIFGTRPGCHCKCDYEYKFCFAMRLGSACTSLRHLPTKVCNSARCFWDWRGYQFSRASDVERCLNTKESCKRRC